MGVNIRCLKWIFLTFIGFVALDIFNVILFDNAISSVTKVKTRSISWAYKNSDIFIWTSIVYVIFSCMALCAVNGNVVYEIPGLLCINL